MDITENQSLESLEGALVALRYVQFTLNEEANKLFNEIKSVRENTDRDLANTVEQVIQLKIAENNLALAKEIGIQVGRVSDSITKTREIMESVKNNPLPKKGNQNVYT